MPPKTTTWTLESHTKGKHLVLESYMQAWLPIMTKWNGRVLFIDAFAGPGEYSGGEPGSPVIALRALLDHRAMSHRSNKVKFLFIEKRPDRCAHLDRILHTYQLPANYSYEVINSTFDETMTDVLDSVEQQRVHRAPAFVMIDPFGVSETPMETIAKILGNPRSEVYISFMYGAINRFREHPNFEKHLDDLFGCREWRQGVELPEGDGRKNFFYQLYGTQLRKNGAKYVVHFELYEGERLVYAIFFGTTNLEGCDKMKQAIWKVDPMGDFKFRGRQQGQLLLGDEVVDFGLLEGALQNEFSSEGWVRIEDVTDFVKSDATDFHSGQLKTKTLKPMEAANKIEAQVETEGDKKRRAETYPNGRTKLRFL